MQDAEGQPPPWWEDAIRLKDELPLRELASRLGVPVATLTSELRRRGVARRARIAEASPPASEESSSHRPDRRHGSKDVQIEKYFHLLGKVPDSEVSRLADVSVRTIASYRARNEIPGYVGPRRRPAPRGRRESKVDEFTDLLGVVPDRVIAEIAGMSLGAVRNFRIKKDIPAAGRMPAGEIARLIERHQVAPAAPASSAPLPTSERPVAVARGDRAWRCERADGQEAFVVLAPSLTEAAARAAEVLGAEHLVRSLEHLGVVLVPDAPGTP
ncbi:MAG: hypothetical protein H6732_08995 [Alphaproteobacteria bacterium]|nr:hypothetical protein [Alphaproteobacteria bacterium]